MRLSAGPSIAYRRVGKLRRGKQRKVSDLSDLSDLSDKRSHYATVTPPSIGSHQRNAEAEAVVVIARATAAPVR